MVDQEKGGERKERAKVGTGGFEGRTKELIRIKGAHGRRKRVPGRRSSIGKGAPTICRINPGNNK